MKRIPSFLFCLTLLVCAGSWLPTAAWAQTGTPGDSLVNLQLTKLGQMLYYMEHYYMDTLNMKAITEQVLKDAVQQLDPHSVYIPAKEVEQANADLLGGFEGVGVEFNILHDTLVVVNPVAGGPSEQVGIRPGDRIVRVDGVDITGKTLNNNRVFELLRGPKGSKVKLGISRKNVPEILCFDVTRDKIPLNSVAAAFEAAPGVLYLKLSRFAATTMSEVIEVFKPGHLFTDMPAGIILDLRGNGGGYMRTALQISDQFLEKDQLILYTEGSHAPRRDEKASGRGFLTDIPVVVLIDPYSASSSEIVAGALQDWDRAIIIGRRSFGKGLVQSQLPLTDGSQIRLTVARYHTPSGRVVQAPYEMGGTEDYYQTFAKRYARGEAFSRDSIRLNDTLAFKTLRTGRTVYGGGGIIPDIFIPADTTFVSPFYEAVYRAGALTDFMIDYYDSHRDRLKAAYPNVNIFLSGFKEEDLPWDAFLKHANSKGMSPTEADLSASAATMKLQMKAFIANRLFKDGAYYQVMLPGEDACYEKALEVIGNWAQYAKDILE